MLVTYRFDGPADDIYATLVVRLHHTVAFQSTELWKSAADFKTQTGTKLGFTLTRETEGSSRLEVYFEPDVDGNSRVLFLRYVHDHLMQHAQNVARLRRYFCGDKKCDAFGQAFGDQAKIAKALAPGGKGKVFCPDCGKPILLRDVIEAKPDQELALGRLLAAAGLRRHAGRPHVGWRNPLDGRDRLPQTRKRRREAGQADRLRGRAVRRDERAAVAGEGFSVVQMHCFPSPVIRMFWLVRRLALPSASLRGCNRTTLNSCSPVTRNDKPWNFLSVQSCSASLTCLGCHSTLWPRAMTEARSSFLAKR